MILDRSLQGRSFPPERFILDCRGRALDLRPGMAPTVMGILNVTPDSFSDGGRFLDADAALFRAETMIGEGAAIIDVGGESTRPKGNTYGAGAKAVGEDEERRRVLPVVEALSARFPEVLLSVDTYKAGVAKSALEAGAHLINDVTGLRGGDDLARVAASSGAPLILMHALGAPGEMPHSGGYTDVVAEVRASLTESAARAAAAGVRGVVLDPGFGFGKTPDENLRLLGSVDRLLDAGLPVMVGISRKSTIGVALGSATAPAPVDARLFGTLGATAVAVLRGATLVRTHDVRATVEMLRVMEASCE